MVGSAQRRWGTMAMLGLALGLAGCAAGAPAAVVPDPSAEQAASVIAAPELTPLPEAAASTSDAPALGAATSDAAAGEVAANAPDLAADAAPEQAVDAAPAVPGAATEIPAPAVGVVDVASEPPAGGETAGPVGAANGAAPDAAVTTDPAQAALASDAAPAGDATGVAAPAFASAPAAASVGAAQEVAAAPVVQETAAPPEVAAQETGRPPIPELDGSGASQLIEGHDDGRKEVALTFDAGSDRGYTDQILDFLRDNGIKGTFGMTGSFAEAHPDLILRMVNEGHQLINHSWSHGSMTGANTGEPPWTYEQLADELARTEQVVRDITGGYELKPYFRPPFGDYDATSLGYLHDLGYPFTIMWTCDTQAWRGWDAAKILDYCTTVTLEDDIILMHVGASAAGDFEVLPSMVAWYLERGYTFVTVEEMLQP